MRLPPHYIYQAQLVTVYRPHMRPWSQMYDFPALLKSSKPLPTEGLYGRQIGGDGQQTRDLLLFDGAVMIVWATVCTFC
jgi:hypothetical protein